MSSSQNPYAAPSADADADSERLILGGSDYGVRREGSYLVIPAHGTSLPRRCVVCNAPGGTRLLRKLYWHPSAYYLLILVGVLFYAIAAVIVRKRAHFELGLCDQHARRRRNGILIGWLGTLASVVGLIALDAAGIKSAVPMVLLGLSLVACPIIGFRMAQIVSAYRIDKQNAWLRVGRPFLDSF
jgi:hypothetical protein